MKKSKDRKTPSNIVLPPITGTPEQIAKALFASKTKQPNKQTKRGGVLVP